MLRWMEGIVRRLPRRTVIIHFANENARVGRILAVESGGATRIGEEGAETKNKSGRLLREWACRNQLCLLNTVDPAGTGPTWSGGSRCQSRPDFVMMGIWSFWEVTRIWVDYHAGWELQLSKAWSWMDHAPVIVTWSYRYWHGEVDGNAACLFTRKQADCLQRSKAMQEELCVVVSEQLHTIEDILEDVARRGGAVMRTG